MDKFVCDQCNGKKRTTYAFESPKKTRVFLIFKAKHYRVETFTCTKCNGEGYLDWIENARGESSSPFQMGPATHAWTHFYLFFEWDRKLTAKIVNLLFNLRYKYRMMKLKRNDRAMWEKLKG